MFGAQKTVTIWLTISFLFGPQVVLYARGEGVDKVLVFHTGVQSPIIDILNGRVREACHRIGRVCEVRRSGSAARALLTANEEGDGDALRPSHLKQLAPEKSRNLLQVPEAIYYAEIFVYTWRNDLEITGFQSFAGLANGARVGVKVLEKNIPGDIVLLPNSTRLFQMLVEKRLDTVSEHGDIGDFIIWQHGYNTLCKRGFPLLTLPGHLYINRKHREIVEELSVSLASMKNDGSFQHIKEEVLENLLIKPDWPRKAASSRDK